MAVQNSVAIGEFNGRSERENFVQDHAQDENVGALIQSRVSVGLFWRRKGRVPMTAPSTVL
jgi:hypothetical protein